MQTSADGTVTLLPPPSAYVNPIYEFWHRHPDLIDDATCLWDQSEQVPCLCQRFLVYLSTDLYWVTRDGASPIVFDAFARRAFELSSFPGCRGPDRSPAP